MWESFSRKQAWGEFLQRPGPGGREEGGPGFWVTYDEVEPKSVSDEEIIQDEMASSGDYDLIICVGAEQVDALTNVASAYPEQRFALLDADSDLANVASYSL